MDRAGKLPSPLEIEVNMETVKSWYNAVVNFVATNPEMSVAIYVATFAVVAFLF
jgi:hypothetical protein